MARRSLLAECSRRQALSACRQRRHWFIEASRARIAAGPARAAPGQGGTPPPPLREPAMRLLLFRSEPGSDARVGAQREAGGNIADLSSATASSPRPFGSSMRTAIAALFDRSDATLAAAAVAAEAALADEASFCVAEASVELLAPIYDPEKVICVGMNYADHCSEQGIAIPKEPLLFNKWPSAIIASGEDIVMPGATRKLDFEVEMVVVVGKRARHVRKEHAMEYVAGFSVAHDVSARDLQLEMAGGQWMLGKCFDTSCPLGPAIVTTDSIKDPHALRLTCELNGEVVQDSSTAQMVFKTADIIEYASRFFTLSPGDIILTGTPPGVGCFRKPEPLWLKPGDVVTCTVEGIGSVTNKVVADPVSEIPPAGVRPAAAAAAAAAPSFAAASE